MAISFRPIVKLLKAKGQTKSALKTNKVVGGSTYTIIVNSFEVPIEEGVSISAINAICRYLDCQPGDIMEYVPDDKTDE